MIKKKLKSIILIDDDESTNYLHNLVLEEMECTEQVVVFENAELALNYLIDQNEADGYVQPDLIFLDINMPRWNGWDFLEKYHALSEEKRSRIIILMLTTSLMPQDQKRAESDTLVNGFYRKPLDEQIIEDIFKKHFAHCL